MKTIQDVSKETLKIEAYLSDKPEGQFLSYKEIQQETNVQMNERGKQFLRRAMKRLKLEYECIRGAGIKLASENSATTIVVHRLARIDNAVKKGEKTHKVIKNQFYERLTDTEKKGLDLFGYAFAAIRAGANYGKKLLKAKVELGNFKQPELKI